MNLRIQYYCTVSVTLVVCWNPDAPLATTCTVDVPAGLCGELPHAVTSPQTPPSTSKNISNCTRVRLRPPSSTSSGTNNTPASAVSPGRASGPCPALADTPVSTVIVTLAELLLPVNVYDVGEKLHIASAGNPPHENCSVPVNPLAAVSVSASDTLPAGATVS